MNKQSFDKEFVFDLPRIEDKRGNLSFIEVETHIPFPIKRAYWICSVPNEQKRASNVFGTQQEVIIALSGSFDVVLNNGEAKKRHTLNSPSKALYVPNRAERLLENFSTNAVCLVLSSETNTGEEYKSLSEINNRPQYYTVSDCSLFEFPITEKNIVSIEGGQNIPFNIERVFYIYNIPKGVERGMHAHKYCHELLVAATGSFEVDLDDGVNKKTILLNSPQQALHIPPGVWASQKNYSSGVTCLAFASKKYNLDGYINSYEEFKEYRDNES